MNRIYKDVIKEHLENDSQMVFLAGPRHVGKTTLAQESASLTNHFQYFNWDNLAQRKQLIDNANGIFEAIDLKKIKNKKAITVFDEIHKYKKWRIFIKGLYDTYRERTRIVVPESSPLNIDKKFSDSLMGRYFLYRIHPLSIGEIIHQKAPKDLFLRPPSEIKRSQMNNLLNFGGFPDPYLKKNKRYYNQWQLLRREQLFKGDIRDLTQIQDLPLMEVLYEFLHEQASQLLSYNSLSKKLMLSSPTIKSWINIFEELYYCFKIKPWHKNITRSLIKEPKLYLYDWSQIQDKGQKIENFVASHLLKAVHFWTDVGLGSFELYFLRDRNKREVDFLLTQDKKPWILIEVKSSENKNLSDSLPYFQKHTQAPFALQLAYDMPYEPIDFRKLKKPTIIPMTAFLSQLP